MILELIKADITTIKADAIVNAANTSLLGGGGVDGAIHRKGGKAILDACVAIRNKQGQCKTGNAVITTAGNLPAKYVIHTVGPVWRGGNSNEGDLLASCYRNSLTVAKSCRLKSIAFPSISTGIYGFPIELAAPIALMTTKTFLEENTGVFEKIIFVLFSDEDYDSYCRVYKNLK